MNGHCLFWSSQFSRSHSKEIENLSGLAEDSKPLEAWSMSNKIQLERRLVGQLKTKIKEEEGNAET